MIHHQQKLDMWTYSESTIDRQIELLTQQAKRIDQLLIDLTTQLETLREKINQLHDDKIDSFMGMLPLRPLPADTQHGKHERTSGKSNTSSNQ